MQSVMRHVLAVDDDERILAMYRRSFSDDCVVHCAATLDQGTALIDARPYDAAVLDLHLGTGSSISLVRLLRAASKNARIVVVSGYLTIEATVVAVRAGADVVATKPIHPRELARRLFGEVKDDIDIAETPTLEQAIQGHIARVYNDCNGNVTETARRLGIYRSSLQRRLRKTVLKRV